MTAVFHGAVPVILLEGDPCEYECSGWVVAAFHSERFAQRALKKLNDAVAKLPERPDPTEDEEEDATAWLAWDDECKRRMGALDPNWDHTTRYVLRELTPPTEGTDG